VAAITVNKAEEIEAWTRAAMAAVKPWKGKRAIGWVDRKTATSAGKRAV
jgi:hypothetical protein